MTCIHNNFDEDQSWGGCIHCSEEEKHRAYYERNHPPVYYDPPEPEFIPNVPASGDVMIPYGELIC